MIDKIYAERYYLNGINIYDRWGIIIEKGGYAELQRVAKRKEQYARVWKDKSGTERFVANALFEDKAVQLPITFLAKDLDEYLDRSRGFFDYIKGLGYFKLYSKTLKQEWTLLYDSVASVEDKTEMYQTKGEVITTHNVIFLDDFTAKNDVFPFDEMKGSQAYGVKWNANNADSALQRIGDHSDLKVHNKMRGCLLSNSGVVNYYLDAKDWTKKEDGTASKLDGTDGDVMVEIPDTWFMFGDDGDSKYLMVSDVAIEGWTHYKKRYVSAYEATLQRSTGTMRSVMNATDDFKGHTGAKGNLAPLTNVNRGVARGYARKRKGYEVMDFTTYNILVWLYFIEFADRNSQLPFPKGLGEGLTTLTSQAWTNYNNIYGLPIIGKANKLGNGSGEVNIGIVEFPNAMMNKFRGIENFFGHVVKLLDGVMPYRDFDKDLFTLFISDNPELWNDANNDGYKEVGQLPLSDGYIKDTLFPFNTPKKVGGSSTTFYCDNYYAPPGTSEYKWYGVGGHGYSSALSGVGYSDLNHKVLHAFSRYGFRLTFLPN